MEYQHTDDMYRDYHRAMMKAASTLYSEKYEGRLLPRHEMKHRQREMWAHNLYKKHLEEGNIQQVEEARQQRNHENRKYDEEKKKFLELGNE